MIYELKNKYILDMNEYIKYNLEIHLFSLYFIYIIIPNGM